MELADVLDSKSSGSDTVSVRPRSPAPKKEDKHLLVFFFWCLRSMGRNLAPNSPPHISPYRQRKIAIFIFPITLAKPFKQCYND